MVVVMDRAACLAADATVVVRFAPSALVSVLLYILERIPDLAHFLAVTRGCVRLACVPVLIHISEKTSTQAQAHCKTILYTDLLTVSV